MRKLLFVFLLCNLAYVAVLAHPFNAASYVVVDTDGGVDDFLGFVPLAFCSRCAGFGHHRFYRSAAC